MNSNNTINSLNAAIETLQRKYDHLKEQTEILKDQLNNVSLKNDKQMKLINHVIKYTTDTEIKTFLLSSTI